MLWLRKKNSLDSLFKDVRVFFRLCNLSCPFSRDQVTVHSGRRVMVHKSSRGLHNGLPEGGADFPAAIFLAGKCRNLEEPRFGKGMSTEKFNSQSPAIHRMAETSSLNCLACRVPYQCLRSLTNALPAEFLANAVIRLPIPSPHSVKRRFSSLLSASSHPLPQTPFQTLAGIAFCACGKSWKNIPEASKLARKLPAKNFGQPQPPQVFWMVLLSGSPRVSF